jgi:hypothetical protein
MMTRDPIEGDPWEQDRSDTEAQDIAQQDFYRFCVHELEKNRPWGQPAALLLAQLSCAYTLRAQRDERDWDPLSARIFEAVEDLGWSGAVRIIGQALETVA